MEGANESTELRWHPSYNIVNSRYFNYKILPMTCFDPWISRIESDTLPTEPLESKKIEDYKRFSLYLPKKTFCKNKSVSCHVLEMCMKPIRRYLLLILGTVLTISLQDTGLSEPVLVVCFIDLLYFL